MPTSNASITLESEFSCKKMKHQVVSILLLHLLVIHSRSDKILWEQFKETHGKWYDSKETESARYEIFLDNLQLIQDHNELYKKGGVTYRMGVTPFADWDKNEFQEWLMDYQEHPTRDIKLSVVELPRNLKMPNSVDWRTSEGVVFGVPDDTKCKASWAFSAVGAVEGQNAIINDVRIKLSEQQIVDCADLGNWTNGCQGGYVNNAFEYILENGLLSNDSYPWRGETDSICAIQGYDEEIVSIKEIAHVTDTMDAIYMALAYIGPMSALLDVSYMQHYTGGIFFSKHCLNSTAETINHPVLLVGYEETGIGGYWLIRNTWGTSWGEEGYLRLNKSEHYDCGITTNVFYPILY